VITVLLALAAAGLFALGAVLQQRIAMAYPDHVAHRAMFMLQLCRHPTWLAGVAATAGGFVFHAAALGTGEIVVVEPILSLTLVLALPLGALLSKQRITQRDLVASVVVAAALGAFLVLSNPAAGIDEPSAGAWVLNGGICLAAGAALTIGGLRQPPAMKATLVGAAAGVLFGLHAAVTKGMVEQFDNGILGPLESWQLYGVLVLGWISLTVAQISYQAGDLPPAISTQSIGSPIVAIVLGVTLFEERIHHTVIGHVLSLAALTVMMAGLAALALRPEPAKA
jgi:drug/metabolite transporter (DMT)-like permease